LFSRSGGLGKISSCVINTEPRRTDVPMQSEPLSPPPITTTCSARPQSSGAARCSESRPHPRRFATPARALCIDHPAGSPALVRRNYANPLRRVSRCLTRRSAAAWRVRGRATCWSWRVGSRPPFSAPARCSTRSPSGSFTLAASALSRSARFMHNSASFTIDLVMAECWTAGVKAGIDAATVVKVFNQGL